MEEKDLSQNPDKEAHSSEQEQQKVSDSKRDKLVKAVVKDLTEFHKFDLIHQIYFLILSRDALSKLVFNFEIDSVDPKNQFKSFIENYSKSTYVIIRNYLQKKNLAKINDEISNIAKLFMTWGHFASDLYLSSPLFSLNSYEMLKFYLTSTFVLPLVKKADSKLLYDDIKSISIFSKTREITTDFIQKQSAIITNLTDSSADITYSAYALKKSILTFNECYRFALELYYQTLSTEKVLSIPYPNNYDGDKDPEKMNKVYIKVDKEYKSYYKEKIKELVGEFFQSEITPAKAAYFYITFETYLAYATRMMQHENGEVGIYLALTIAEICSREFAKNLKSEDFQRVPTLKNICSTIINKSLTVLYAVGNIVDHHELKEVNNQIKEAFSNPEEHYMGVIDLTVYSKAWFTLAKYGKEGLENFSQRKRKDTKE